MFTDTWVSPVGHWAWALKAAPRSAAAAAKRNDFFIECLGFDSAEGFTTMDDHGIVAMPK
jgi:hypothetical protein